MTQPINLPQVLTPLPNVNHEGFSPAIIDKLNNFFITNSIIFSKEYFHKYLEFINTISVNDAKQIIYIWNITHNLSTSFDYRSEEDILLDLTTIVGRMQNPQFELGELLRAKVERCLPANLHKWFENDLVAMLYFTHRFPTLLNEKSYIGRQEFANAFMNFIQFHAIDFQNDRFGIIPLSFVGNPNRLYYQLQFENYKKWYLDYIFPRKNFNWLEKCEETQLDNLLDRLEEKGLVILKGVFYPKTKEDKVSLIIASINNIAPEQTLLKKVSEDITTSIALSIGEFTVREYYGYIIFDKGVFNIEYDEEKFEGVGLPLNQVCSGHPPLYYQGSNYLNYTPRQLNNYGSNEILFEKMSVILVGIIETIQSKGRQYYLDLIYESTRQKKHRENKRMSEEELTVKIYKKNMPLLKKLTDARKITPSKYINELIEDTYKIRFSDD